MQAKTLELQNKIISFLKSNLPISGDEKVLDIKDITVTEPAALNDIGRQLEMRYSGKGDLKGWVRGKIVISDKKSGKVISQSGAMNLVPVHFMTDRGTYIINGTEKTILNQMRLKPGSYTEKGAGESIIKTQMFFSNSNNPGYMPAIFITYEPSKISFKITVKRGGDISFDGVDFLRAFGLSDVDIVKAIGNDSISDILMKKSTEKKGINEIYKAITGKNSTETPDRTRAMLMEFLSQNSSFGTGETTIKSTIGSADNHLTRDVLLKSISKCFSVARNDVEEDAKEDLRYKEVLDENDLIMEKIQKDFDEFREKSIPALNEKRDVSYVNIKSIAKLGTSVDKFMKKSSIVQSSEETNPLFMSSINRRVTQLGEGTNLSEKNLNNITSPRNLKVMGINRLDPVETPESGKVGLVEHLSQSAIIRNKTIYIPVLKVYGKEISDTKSNTVELSPTDEYDVKVAFFDTNYVERSGNKIIFKKDVVPARYRGKIETLPVSEIQYIDKAPQNVLGYTANMIPFVNHDDGNRALMGTNMQKQAIILKNREVPLVSASVNGTDKTYEDVIGDQYGKPVRSDVDGVVSSIDNSKITVKDDSGKLHSHSYYYYFPLNQSYINNEIVVKVGDRVKKNQVIAEGWQTKDGKLALGVNARVGYLPFKGFNYEDGVVVSEDFANRMASEEIEDYPVDIPADAIGGVGSNVLQEIRRGGYTTDGKVFSGLNADGIIKEGSHVKAGDILVGILMPEKQDDVSIDALLSQKNKQKYQYRSLTIAPSSYVSGEIKRINIVNNPEHGIKQKIIFTIATSKPLKVGDKVSGKHGNKGTIAKVLSQPEMPVAADGKALDVCFSPLAVPSRKNVGQLLEAASGLIAEKTGKPIIVNNFDSSERKKVEDGLKAIGVPDGKMKVTLKELQPDGTIKEVETENPVVVGNMYMLRLKHKVDEKIQARSNKESNPEMKTNMPRKDTGLAQGEKHNPQSIGEMEMRALQAHGAVWNILESSTVKADGGGDVNRRAAIFDAIATGELDGLDFPATPETLKLTADNLKGMGLSLNPLNNGKNVKSFDQAFNSLSLTPIKPSEMIKMIGKNNEITTNIISEAKVTGDDEFAKGGVYDPEIFGERGSEDSRRKWGYIKLATPMPNPALLKDQSFNPYSALTGKKQSEITKMMSGKAVVIIDPKTYTGSLIGPKDREQTIKQCEENMQKAGLKPGQLIDPNKLEQLIDQYGIILWKAGGEWIQDALDNIDVKKEIASTQKVLKAAKGDPLDKAYKKYKMLLTLKNNKMTPSDLMMHYVPVTPTYMRPYIKKGNDVNTADLSTLYANLVKSNSPMSLNYENGFDMISDANPREAANDTASIFKKLSNVVGTDPYIDPRNKKEYKGIKENLSGKEGLIRGKMLSKRVDFSGRSVIGVDPQLGLNEVALPIDMAKYLYRPFILKELVSNGYARNITEAEKKWKSSDKDVKSVLNKIVEDRPVLMNRQPSLHELSIMAMKPIIKDTQDGEVVRNIQMSPLIVTAFNADFDGDTMSVHVPITERAKDEAKKLMMPSENMINVTNGKLIFEIRHEMALGIYYLTTNADKPVGKAKSYSSYAQLKKDYLNGELKTTDAVSIAGMSNVTAGYALFILLIPQKYRTEVFHSVSKPWSAGDMKNLFEQMYEDCENSNGKNISKIEICKIMDNVKMLGFEASTKSGVSLGLNDLKPVDKIKKSYNKAITDAKKTGKSGDVFVAAQNAEKEIEQKIKSGEVFSENNPANILMQSGARGNAGQFRRIMSVVGMGADVEGNPIQPIRSSLVDGLSPAEYWTLGYDSRKGIFDRSVATSDPGTLTREIWAAAQDVVVKEKDCGTADGTILNKNNNSIIGRVATQNIVSKKGNLICAKGSIITKQMFNDIYKDDTIETVKVRSTLKCKTVGGVCQKCYGTLPGNNALVPIGTAIGVIASQAVGEPFTQGSMNTFHTGGTSSFANTGMPRVKNIFDLSVGKSVEAVLATVSGKVTNIVSGASGTSDTVFINSVSHKVPHINGIPQKIKVQIGDQVTKGDFLTPGDSKDLISGKAENITSANPVKFFKAKTDAVGQDAARSETQDYLINSLNYAITQSLDGSNKHPNSNKINQRHLETIVSKMTSKVKILDSGSSSYIKGQETDKNAVDQWNSSHTGIGAYRNESITNKNGVINKVSVDLVKTKKGMKVVGAKDVITEDVYNSLVANGVKNIRVVDKPIVYENLLMSKGTVADNGNESFFSNMGARNIGKQIARGATMGQIDTLDDPRSRLMTGKLLRLGEGFKVPRDIADSISTKMKNLFTKNM